MAFDLHLMQIIKPNLNFKFPVFFSLQGYVYDSKCRLCVKQKHIMDYSSCTFLSSKVYNWIIVLNRSII